MIWLLGLAYLGIGVIVARAVAMFESDFDDPVMAVGVTLVWPLAFTCAVLLACGVMLEAFGRLILWRRNR